MLILMLTCICHVGIPVTYALTDPAWNPDLSSTKHIAGKAGRLQQTVTISGKVVDNKGKGVAGATVFCRENGVRVITDFDGLFRIQAPSVASILSVSHIGYRSVDFTPGRLQPADVVLIEMADNLDEVVVIGYGEIKRRDLTGAVGSIRAEEIAAARNPSFLESIQGKLAGVQISGSSGEPAAAMNITIRGASSLYGSSTPLFVIDGIPYDINTSEVASSSIGNATPSNPLAALNPNDIQSIEVLKDASASAIYGSRGANGVVIVTTKSGKTGRTSVVYDGFAGIQHATKKMEVLSADEFIEYQRVQQPNSPLFWIDTNDDGTFDNRDTPRDLSTLTKYDWQSEVLRQGNMQSHNLSVSGGKDRTTFSGSLGYYDQTAISLSNEYQKYNVTLKLDHEVNKKLSMGINQMLMYTNQDGVTNSGGGVAIMNGVVQNIIISRPIDLYDPRNDFEGEYITPIKSIVNSYKNVGLLRNNISAYLAYQLFPSLRLYTQLGGMYSSSPGKEFYGKLTSWGSQDNGRGVIQGQQAYSINNSYQLQYNKRFNKSHTLGVLGAFEYYRYNFESSLFEKANFIDESTGIHDISKGNLIKRTLSSRDGNTRLSYFTRINYNLVGRHLFTATYRIDGSDKFGPGNRFGHFPSFAYAWRAGDESFVKNQLPFVDDLKIRASIGVIGNERVPSFRYMARVENAFYGGQLGLAPASRSNPNLRWESTGQANIGLDIVLFKNRLNVTADIYEKRTTDMLLPLNVASRSGYFTEWRNFGKMENRGFEIQLSTVNVAGSSFRWSTDFNISANRNKVTELGNVGFIPVTVAGGWITDVGRVIVGQPIGTAYGYEFDGVYQIDDFTWQNDSDESIPHANRTYVLKEGVVSVAGVNVKPGSFKFKDLNGDNQIRLGDDRKVISQSAPDFFGGLTNTFTYKGFDLSVFLEYSYGNQIFNEPKYRLAGAFPATWMNLQRDLWYNRWTPENPTNEYGTTANVNETARLSSSYYVEDASWLRVKNVSLSYTLQHQSIRNVGINSVKVYLTGSNLYTWTKYTGFDPEISSPNTLLPGFERISYPRATTYILGLTATF